MTFSKKLLDIKQKVLADSQPLFTQIDAIAEANTLKVLDAPVTAVGAPRAAVMPGAAAATGRAVID